MNYIISICDPKAAPKLTEICSELGLRIAVSLHGRGTAVRSMLDILGIEDNEKRVILTIAKRKKTKEFIKGLNRVLLQSYLSAEQKLVHSVVSVLETVRQSALLMRSKSEKTEFLILTIQNVQAAENVQNHVLTTFF